MHQPFGRRVMVVSLVINLLLPALRVERQTLLSTESSQPATGRSPARTLSLNWPTPDNT
ncbi:hypothetical protein GCM10022421_28590 [Oceanisphaera sediminis]|uniref:Uncharacterized protein n=1 Tax=Oceanisphaera sediminis TaxID=981381 RepID=A0ABP7EFZ8_9GAMM